MPNELQIDFKSKLNLQLCLYNPKFQCAASFVVQLGFAVICCCFLIVVDCRTLKWNFENFDCKSEASDDVEIMNWSTKVGCWLLDCEDASWNGETRPDDDVFDFSSGMENDYLILNVDTLVTTRKVAVSGLTSGDCENEIYGPYTAHIEYMYRGDSNIYIANFSGGTLNVTSFITNNLCLDDFTLKIYKQDF